MQTNENLNQNRKICSNCNSWRVGLLETVGNNSFPTPVSFLYGCNCIFFFLAMTHKYLPPERFIAIYKGNFILIRALKQNYLPIALFSSLRSGD